PNGLLRRGGDGGAPSNRRRCGARVCRPPLAGPRRIEAIGSPLKPIAAACLGAFARSRVLDCSVTQRERWTFLLEPFGRRAASPTKHISSRRSLGQHGRVPFSID